LGIKGKIRKLDIHFGVDEFATATVEMLIPSDMGPKFVAIIEKYNLKINKQESGK